GGWTGPGTARAAPRGRELWPAAAADGSRQDHAGDRRDGARDVGGAVGEHGIPGLGRGGEDPARDPDRARRGGAGSVPDRERRGDPVRVSAPPWPNDPRQDARG